MLLFSAVSLSLSEMFGLQSLADLWSHWCPINEEFKIAFSNYTFCCMYVTLENIKRNSLIRTIDHVLFHLDNSTTWFIETYHYEIDFYL